MRFLNKAVPIPHPLDLKTRVYYVPGFDVNGIDTALSLRRNTVPYIIIKWSLVYDFTMVWICVIIFKGKGEFTDQNKLAGQVSHKT